jgi:hypothetical protein
MEKRLSNGSWLLQRKIILLHGEFSSAQLLILHSCDDCYFWYSLPSNNICKSCVGCKSYMLGDCLLDGEGVEMDRGAALEWLIRSAELGHR